MDPSLAQKAISEALIGNWKEAIKINKQILSNYPDDVEAVNRLSKAMFETGDLKKAQKYARAALRLDPLNTIAKKSLEKYSQATGEVQSIKSAYTCFLEEPGKTKTVELINLGKKDVILSLSPGSPITLKCGQYKVSVLSGDGKHIGKLPDDTAAKLIKLTRAKISLIACIKSATEDKVKIFIRLDPKNGQQTSCQF